MLTAASVLRADEVVWEAPALTDVEVDEGTTLVITNAMDAGSARFSGDGIIEVRGCRLSHGSFDTYGAFTGTLAVVNGELKPNSPLHDNVNYIFGGVRQIRLENGRIGSPGVRWSGINNEWYRNGFDIVAGTTNYIDNTVSRDANGAVHLHLDGGFTGAGYVKVTSGGMYRNTFFAGDNGAFSGTMELSGASTFRFEGASSVMPLATLMTGSSIRLNAGSSPCFGALWMTKDVSVAFTGGGTTLTIGDKGDCLLRGSLTGSDVEIVKVGGGSSLCIPGDLLTVAGSVLSLREGCLALGGGSATNMTLRVSNGTVLRPFDDNVLAGREEPYDLITVADAVFDSRPAIGGTGSDGWFACMRRNEDGTVCVYADRCAGVSVSFK